MCLQARIMGCSIDLQWRVMARARERRQRWNLDQRLGRVGTAGGVKKGSKTPNIDKSD